MQEDQLGEVALKVKSIDDFIDRFNANPSEDLQRYLDERYPDLSLTREDWIWSLFNRQAESLKGDSLAHGFIKQVIDSVSPVILSFKDRHWYSKVQCRVLYQKNEYTLSMTLKIKKSTDGFSWSVVSAHSPFLDSNSQVQAFSDSLRADSTHKYFLSPVSHGIDFVNLEKFFRSESSVRNYLLFQENTSETEKLVSLIAKREVVFNKVDFITYYLLQVKGWIIRIEYFERPGNSSGWLIDALLRVTPREKEEFMHHYLDIPKRK